MGARVEPFAESPAISTESLAFSIISPHLWGMLWTVEI
jgi:hypothetical protein